MQKEIATGGVNGKAPKYLYLMSGSSGIVKIGISVDPSARERQLQTSNANEVSLVETWGPFNSPHEIEGIVHRRFSDARMYGEWFKVDTELAAAGIDALVSAFTDSRNQTTEERETAAGKLNVYIGEMIGVNRIAGSIDSENTIVARALRLAESTLATADLHEKNFLEAIELSDFYQAKCKALLGDLSKLADENCALNLQINGLA